jgi:hypothetical protein
VLVLLLGVLALSHRRLVSSALLVMPAALAVTLVAHRVCCGGKFCGARAAPLAPVFRGGGVRHEHDWQA